MKKTTIKNRQFNCATEESKQGNFGHTKRMKKMKLMIAAILIALSVLAVSLVGCYSPAPPPIPEEGANIVIIIGTDEFELITHQRYVFGAIRELVEREDLDFEYSYTRGSGAFIDVLGDLENGYGGAWLLFYSSLDANEYPQWSDPWTYEKGGTTFWSASLGISSMPVIDGVTYLFALVSF